MGKPLYSDGRSDTQNSSFYDCQEQSPQPSFPFEIKRKVHQEIVDKYDSELNNPDFYLSDELFRLYEEALKRLPKEYLEAYEMNRNQHLTHKEIAEKLNVSPQTINYRIGQALKLLRVALKDYLPLFILIFGPNFFEQS